VDELYVVARCVLLDALEALRDHSDATVVVGAQAIYIRAGEADLGQTTRTPSTCSGSCVVSPRRNSRSV
jgi:hypothetical protein